MQKTGKTGGPFEESLTPLMTFSTGQTRSGPTPKSWKIWAAWFVTVGRDLRLDGSERLLSSCCVRPSPSDDLRRKKMPLTRSVRLPKAKTRGMVVNLVAGEEKNQRPMKTAPRPK